MQSHLILEGLNDLRKKWRDQDFKLSATDQAVYDELLRLRRERVAGF